MRDVFGRVRFLVIILLLLILAVSCNGEAGENGGSQSGSQSGGQGESPQADDSQMTLEHYKSMWKSQKHVVDDEVWTVIFDEKGNILSVNFTREDGYNTSHTYEYVDGVLRTETDIGYDGSSTITQYDAYGFETSRKHYDSNGDLERRYVQIDYANTYTDGKLTKRVRQQGWGLNVDNYTELYSYDSEGRLILTQEFHDDKLSQQDKYEYDGDFIFEGNEVLDFKGTYIHWVEFGNLRFGYKTVKGDYFEPIPVYLYEDFAFPLRDEQRYKYDFTREEWYLEKEFSWNEEKTVYRFSYYDYDESAGEVHLCEIADISFIAQTDGTYKMIITHPYETRYDFYGKTFEAVITLL